VRLGLASAPPLAVALALVVGACASVSEKPPAAPAARSAPAAPAPSPPAPPPPDPRELLAAAHREEARALERDGNLRRALDEWKIALTINPDDAAAQEAQKALEGRIERTVTEKIEAGRAALARGVQAEARRQFLAALALDPANRTAFGLLQTEAREPEFLTYTVRQGDTLQSLAQRYYGDRSRSEVIWETNQLPPNPRLTAGMLLKIPEIPGVPFIRPEVRRPAPVPPASASTPDATKTEPPKDEPPDVNPLLVEAREALERNDYADALSDVDKLLAGSPGNRDAIALKKQALYQQGKAQLAGRQYDASYRALTQLAKLQPDYEDSPALLRQARTRIVEQHYSQGVKLYREEKLAEAVSEWQAVLEIDPQHPNARRNIEQAERLLKALEERKKK
jgi:tetratricopeptide (TPR) repeat protein